jgi:hypothetical protein
MKFEHKYGFLTDRGSLDQKAKDFYDKVRARERPSVLVSFEPNPLSSKSKRSLLF